MLQIFGDAEDKFCPSFIERELKHKENKHLLWVERGGVCTEY